VEEDPREAAQKEARQIIKKAEAALAEAKSQAEQIRKDAYEQGYQQGTQEGMTACQARLEAGMDNLNRSLAALDQLKTGIMHGMEGEVLALILAVLDRIFLTEEAFPKHLIHQVVREAINQLTDAEKLTVRLSQTDISFVKEIQPELLQQSEELKHLKLLADPNLHPGDCLVESPVSKVDATLATRRKRVLNILEETFQKGGALDLAAALERERPAPSQPEDDLSLDSPDLKLDLEDW
jgi:flagellar assembly protein FliH